MAGPGQAPEGSQNDQKLKVLFQPAGGARQIFLVDF